MGTVLVTGGAGYIGSHTVRALTSAGHRVVVLDDLSAGSAAALPPAVDLHAADLAAPGAAASVVQAVDPDVVVHFAGAIEAGLSASDPARFYRVNVVGSLALADALVAVRARPAPVVYSSSAAVYGNPARSPISEDAPLKPVSVYGRTKAVTEGLFAAYDGAYGLASIALRYFNAAGADASATIGEAHRHETHLIPLALAAARGRGPALRVFGTDYPTPDGTCVRDYVHVSDLADAHVLAVQALLAGAPSQVYNVGAGTGFSVWEVLATVAAVTGRDVPHTVRPRRPGDPAVLVADPTRIGTALGWAPRRPDLASMVRSADAWHASQGPAASAAASKNP